jgi:DNA-binding MarR family transcriptional regulator
MTDTHWLTKDELSAWLSFTLMQLQLFAHLGKELSPTGLSFQDYGVLARLTEAHDGQQRLSDLAAIVGYEKSRMSHHATRMENRGLVERVKCGTDRRGAYLRITDAGRSAIVAAAPDHVTQVRKQMFDLLSPEQVAALDDISRTVLNNLPGKP